MQTNEVNCPACKTKIPDAEIASYLASKAKGVKKNFSAAERKRRAERMAEARKKRHPASAKGGRPKSAKTKPKAKGEK